MDVTMPSSPHAPEASRESTVGVLSGELQSILFNLSHELCRPLVSLRTGFDLLLGESSATISPNQRGHLLTMVSLCDDLLRLTRSYLDYAAIVHGSRPVRLGPFTVISLISEIDRQFASVAAARQISMTTCADPPDAVMVTDASRWQQIVGNLVSNALKYTPPGGEVSVVTRAEPDGWLVIVADSGPGIPADSLERVFDPFFRLPRDELSGIDGSGLGLAICRELATQLDGQVSIESIEGEGTTFFLRLPKVAAPAPQNGRSQRNSVADSPVESATGSQRAGVPR